MDNQPTTAPTDRRPPLAVQDKIILGVHLVLALILAIVGFVESGSSDGFADLARVIVAVIAGLWLTGVVLSGLVARFLVRSPIVRTLIVLVGPTLGVIALFAAARA